MTIFITGASKPVGYSLAKVLLARGNTVYGSTSNPGGARELWQLEAEHDGQFFLVGPEFCSESNPQDFIQQVPEVCTTIFCNPEVFADLCYHLDYREYCDREHRYLKALSRSHPHLKQIKVSLEDTGATKACSQSAMTMALWLADRLTQTGSHATLAVPSEINSPGDVHG